MPTTPATNAQLLLGLKVPVLLVEKVTEPLGVPVPEVTVAVQLVGVLSRTLAGLHETVVLVAPWLAVTVTMKAALVLPVWTESPGKLPVIP